MKDFSEGHFVMQVSSSTPGGASLVEEMMAVGTTNQQEVMASCLCGHD